MAVSSGVFSTFSAHTLPPKALVSSNPCAFTPPSFLKKCQRVNRRNLKLFVVRASSDEADDDCNDEECAPEKEVGKVSMDWLAGEKTRVVGTFPPRTRGWTGYVEKDTAGQTNIYSVEPPVYVAESAISSGSAGSSASGSENTVALTGGLALIFVAAASSIVLQVGKNNPPQVQTIEYSGPSLSYYINKFRATAVVEVSAPSQTESSVVTQADSSAPEVIQVEVQSEQQEPSALTADTIS